VVTATQTSCVLNGCDVSKITVSVSRIDSFGWFYVRVVGGGGGGGGEVGMIAHAHAGYYFVRNLWCVHCVRVERLLNSRVLFGPPAYRHPKSKHTKRS
jgi:hypothetical protein